MTLPQVYADRDVIRKHENTNIRNRGTSEVTHRKCNGLTLGGGQAYTRLGAIKLQYKFTYIRRDLLYMPELIAVLYIFSVISYRTVITDSSRS